MKKKLPYFLTALCALLPCLTFAQAQPNGLSAQAQGDYTLLNPQQQVTKVQFRLKLEGKQWIADGSQDAGATWSPVCDAKGECKLETSGETDVTRFFAQYPHVLEKTDVSCIHNMAFAFCGLTLDGRTDYVMVTLVTNPPQVMAFHKIN